MIHKTNLKTAKELILEEINIALSHTPKNSFPRQIDLTLITRLMDKEEKHSAMRDACKELEKSGFYAYYGSYKTFLLLK